MGYVQTFDTVSTRAEKLVAGAMVYAWNSNTVFTAAPAQAEVANTSGDYRPEMVLELLRAQAAPAAAAPAGGSWIGLIRRDP